MKCCYTVLLFLCFGMLSSADAQTLPDSSKTKNHSYWLGSVDYLSNAVYNGRKDSVAIPYLSATFGYYHKSGLYLSGSASYLTSDHVFDLFSIDAGYNWEISDQFSASFNADKPFYNKSSTNIAAGIKASLDAALTYDTDIITAEATFSTVFSKKTDLLLTGALSHLFTAEGKDDDTYWGIEPTLTANLGTQHFLDEYKARNNKRKTISATSSTVSDGGKFQLLDYEFSLPVSYNSRCWSITFSPVYAIPKNPVTSTTILTVTSAAKTRTQITTDTEQLKNVFYAQLTFDFKFR
ncbi:hypothetical protein [Pedobacter aquatilis]|uniref:hypothetical protein n=1 Tax=Pedobacter aquatilis TaxID=351343 RepID=UPI00293148EC|nr:hypothetical protein [Pedobacter aquatilis]